MLLVTIGDTSTHKLAEATNMQMKGLFNFQLLDSYFATIPFTHLKAEISTAEDQFLVSVSIKVSTYLE